MRSVVDTLVGYGQRGKRAAFGGVNGPGINLKTARALGMAIAHCLAVVAVLPLVQGPLNAQTLPRNVPLPPDVHLTAPPEALPTEVRAFAGTWTGTWANTLDHVLIVEELASPEKTIAVYAWGTAPSWSIYEPGWARVRGRIDAGMLELRLPNGAVVTYAWRSDDELRGEYKISGQITKGAFRRVRE